MSPALMEAPATLFAARPRTARAADRRRTLEDLLESRWHSARSDGHTECPVCQATMHFDGTQARCSHCGTALS